MKKYKEDFEWSKYFLTTLWGRLEKWNLRGGNRNLCDRRKWDFKLGECDNNGILSEVAGESKASTSDRTTEGSEGARDEGRLVANFSKKNTA